METFNVPNPEEMRMFGFDPENEEDVIAFQATDPLEPNKPVTDYSRDAFEFGSSGQHPIVIVESEE